MRIIGHTKQIEKLNRIVEANKISNAYIFYGIKGIGKATIAKEFAKKILGNDSYILIQPEGNIIKVETIRSLKEELMLKPTISDRKIAIIDEAECMNEQSQNALLKILEEPPVYATIILVTSNKEKLLYTIKSRCVDFKFNPLSEEEIQQYFDEPLKKEILEYSRGSIGAVIKSQESENQEVVTKWVQAFKQDSLIELMKEINMIKEEKYIKENLEDFLDYLLYVYYKELKDKNINFTGAIEIVEETRNNISRNANVDIALDRMVINLWKWRKECKK